MSESLNYSNFLYDDDYAEALVNQNENYLIDIDDVALLEDDNFSENISWSNTLSFYEHAEAESPEVTKCKNKTLQRQVIWLWITVACLVCAFASSMVALLWHMESKKQLETNCLTNSPPVSSNSFNSSLRFDIEPRS